MLIHSYEYLSLCSFNTCDEYGRQLGIKLNFRVQKSLQIKAIRYKSLPTQHKKGVVYMLRYVLQIFNHRQQFRFR